MLLFVNVFYCYKQVYRRFFLFFSYFFNNIPVSFLFIVYFFSKRTFFSLYNLHYTFHLKLHSFLIRRLTCRKEKEGITLHNPLLTSFLILKPTYRLVPTVNSQISGSDTINREINLPIMKLLSYFNVHFPKLHFRNFIWCSAHNILCITIHREWQ